MKKLLLCLAMLICSMRMMAQCGTTVYDTGGAGGNYGNNQNLTWAYCAPAGQVLTLTFTSFNTELFFDELSVHDGPTNLSPMMGIFSGTGLPPSFTSTIGGCLTLWFTSDPSTVSSGWSINITCGLPPPPPTNVDPCSSASIALTSACTATTYSNVAGGNSSTTPVPTCGNFIATSQDVWFTFVASPSGYVALQSVAGSLTDGAMAVYSAPSCSGPFTQIACDDDSGQGLMPALTLSGLVSGQTYYIRYWGYGNATGTFSLSGSNTTPNNSCSAPTQICSNQSFCGNSNGFGTQDLNAANTGCLSSFEHQSSWYVFQIATSGTLDMTIATTIDYDFAVWGPYSAIQCPTSAPFRCSYSATYGNTGIGNGAIDVSEGVGGDAWVSTMNVTAGQIYIMVIDNFTSDFTPFTLTWGGTASLNCTPLPIELISFDGHHESNGNKLYWSTATEQENDHFSLERSADLLEWKPIGTVQGAGTSQQAINYSFLDEEYEHVLNYYRLEQTDINGSHEYVGPVVVIDNSREEYKVVRRLNYVGQEVDEFYHGFFIEHRDHGKPVMRFQ